MEAQQHLAKLQFNGFVIRRLDFRLSNEAPNLPINLDFKLQSKISRNDKSVQTTLRCDVFKDKGKKYPFSLVVELVGVFTLLDDYSEDKRIKLRDLIYKNTVAILFPYLRAAITSITSTCNISPMVLPTINIVEYLDGIKNHSD